MESRRGGTLVEIRLIPEVAPSTLLLLSTKLKFYHVLLNSSFYLTMRVRVNVNN